MALDRFFAAASPATLASLIVDIQEAGTGGDLTLERQAREVLVANVGEDEAEEWISVASRLAAVKDKIADLELRAEMAAAMGD